MNIPILKRPMATDSEEELFRMQEEFLKSKQEPSAKVINLRGATKFPDNLPPLTAPTDQSKARKVESRFSQLKKLKTQNRVSTSQTTGEIVNPIIKDRVGETAETKSSDSGLSISSANIVLGNIIEKQYDQQQCTIQPNENLLTASSKSGFPEVFVSDYKDGGGSQSLFSQHISKKQNTETNVDNISGNLNQFENDCKSVVVEGPWAAEIHNENVQRLSQMTQEEILQEKAKLEMALKPDLIEFLKTRKHKNQDSEAMDTTESASNKEIQSGENDNQTTMEVDEQKSLPTHSVQIMEQAKKKGWTHMDSVEPEKLQWMSDLPAKTENEPPANEPYNARFDFNGMLLPYNDDTVPIEKGLHHHGEEPERPGYSLQELLQLCRSSAQQQRCMALTTLANIIKKSRKGWYDKVLHPAPLTALSQKNILLLLRFSLDDTSVAVVTATLQALRAFLCSKSDEVCLDRLYGVNTYKEPILLPPKTDVKDTSDLKDHELAQLDAVLALLRTDIVIRIRYILREMRPPPRGVSCALEILIRLARHSIITALNISTIPHLLDTIVENFIPLSTSELATKDKINNAYGVPLIAALRLCRVLVSYGGISVAQRLDRLKIVHSIMSYITSDTVGLELSIESMRLWKTLLMHEVAKDSIAGAQLILLSQLQLLRNRDLNAMPELAADYAAALVAIAQHEKSYKDYISTILRQWSVQILSLDPPKWGPMKLVAQTVMATDDVSSIKTLEVSRSRVFSKLCSSSNLLSGCSLATDREPSSLPNFGVLTEDGQLQPIVHQHSCIPFLSTVLNAYINISHRTELENIFKIPELLKYLSKLEWMDWSLERSWYTRFELNFLTALIRAASIVSEKLDNKVTNMIWKVAVKLISALPADHYQNVKHVLRAVLSADRLNEKIIQHGLAKLNLDASIGSIIMNLNDDVVSLYEKYVTTTDEWEHAAMPKDWLYLPLVHIYTKCKNNDKCQDKDKASILTILSLELILPDLIGDLSPSLRFSRLLLVYLCDTVYLNENVSTLLTSVVATFLKQHHKKLNFTRDLPGLNSFTDLFTAMCEHFCSTSYGDYGFSVVLLVPICQRHDAHYRKLLWSEHAGLLRYLKLPVEKLTIPLREYLYPIEDDSTLIESYITALVRGTIKEECCPIPYLIAVHHSAMYLKQSSKLAIRMRKQMEKLPNESLANLLLEYKPSVL